MIKGYLSSLELRLANIQKLIGDVKEYKQNEIKEIREGINSVLANMHKDVQRKFQKIKKSLEKYSEVVDSLSTQDKISLLSSQIEELNTTATQLARIEKLLPVLNTDNYLQWRNQYQNYQLLNTCSTLTITNGPQKIKPIQQDHRLLLSYRNEHRTSMNELLELNGQIIKNLSSKIQQLQQRRLKQ